MKRFSRIADLILLLLALLIVPAVHAQDTSDQFLYAVPDDNRDYTVYTVNVDDNVKTQIGTVRGQLGMGNDAGWSPDGKFIYLLDSQELKHPTLTLVDVETHQRQTIPDFLEFGGCSQPFLWSTTGEWVAYTTDSDAQILLKLFNPSNGNILTVATLHSSYPISELGWSTSVSWSYDDRYLSYKDYESGAYHSTIYDVKNQRTVDVLDGVWWSPGENKLAYLNNSHAIIYNLVDGAKQQYEADRIGQWSPDGHFLTIYHVDKDEHKSLSVIDVRANKIVKFGGETAVLGFDTDVVWSPDGHFLAMATRENDYGYKGTAYILDVVKGIRSRLKVEPYVPDSFKWSPTGHELMFISNSVDLGGEGDYTSLWWFDMDHNQSHRYAVKISAYTNFYREAFDWFADGAYAIVDTNSGLVLLDKDAQKLSKIGGTARSYPLGSWWTNGTQIALASYERDKSDIYILKPETNTLKNVTNSPQKVNIFLGWRGDKNQVTLIQCSE